MDKKIIIASIGTAVFGIGKVFSTSGQVVFILENGFKYFSVDDPVPVISTVVIGALSTAYVRSITRFPSLWEFFTGNTPEGISIWENTSRGEKTNVIVMGSLNFLAAVADGVQAYLGSNTLLEVFGLQPTDQPQIPIVIVINSFLGLSCTLAYLAFFGKKSVQNALLLQRQLQSSGLLALSEPGVTKGMVKTILSCSLAGISYVAFVYYAGSAALELIWPSISTPVVISTCTIISASVLSTFVTSRAGQAYKFLTSNEPPITATYQSLTRRDKAIVAPHWLVGFVDIVVFMIASYFSFLGMFASFGITHNWWVEVLPILPCLSVGFMHYVFSLRPAIKTCIENRESYHTLTQAEQIISADNNMHSILSVQTEDSDIEEISELEAVPKIEVIPEIREDTTQGYLTNVLSYCCPSFFYNRNCSSEQTPLLISRGLEK